MITVSRAFVWCVRKSRLIQGPRTWEKNPDQNSGPVSGLRGKSSAVLGLTPPTTGYGPQMGSFALFCLSQTFKKGGGPFSGLLFLLLFTAVLPLGAKPVEQSPSGMWLGCFSLFPLRKTLLQNSVTPEHSGGWPSDRPEPTPPFGPSIRPSICLFPPPSMFQELAAADGGTPGGIVYDVISRARVRLHGHCSVQKTQTEEGLLHLLSKQHPPALPCDSSRYIFLISPQKFPVRYH